MNRTTIINAAAGLFESKGYSATSMRDLAEKVGLMPSSLYSHINSKQEILKEICMQCAYQFTDGMHEVKQNNNNPQQSIDALIKLHVDIANSFPSSIAVFNDEWRFMEAKDITTFKKLRTQYEKNFKDILQEGKDKGIFNFIDLDIVFLIILSSLNRTYQSVGKYNKNKVEVEINHFIKNALKNT